MQRMWIAGTLALLAVGGTLGTLPAQASTSGRRNTAIALGAAAVYELVKGNTTAGIALGAGAAYGYKRYEDEKRYEDRYGFYDRRYGYRRYGALTRRTAEPGGTDRAPRAGEARLAAVPSVPRWG